MDTRHHPLRGSPPGTRREIVSLHYGSAGDIVEPISGAVHPVASRADGLFFARDAQRCVRAGRSLAKVADAVTVRGGRLSSD